MALGEIGYETDGGGNYKIGDGSTVWTSLGYGGLGDIHRTLIDAKGDLIVGTAADIAGRLAVGSDGQHLVADSSAAGGVSWATSTESIEDVVGAQFVTNGSHSGISATYDDAGDGAIDLNVDDFTITLAGDLSGNATITNLADATLTATIVADATALGTDTTGNYVATVAGTANEVEVSGSGSETAAVTVGLPSDVTVTTSLTTPLVNISGASIVLEGATANDFETTLTVTDPTADRTVTLPDATGTVVTTGNLSAATEHIEDTVAAQLVTNGSHSGIAATYDDAGDGAIDLNVDDFTVTLAGDLGGSATITNLADATLTATIQANSVALGTDTTGDYTASLVAGTGVTLTNNSGETATPTVAIGQAVGSSDTPTFGAVTISNAVANATHAATKAYVDNAIAGLDWHEAVNYGSAAALPNTPAYDNGTSGVGATLTAGAQVRLVIDGANATTGNRVLVQDQATGAHNGIYDVTAQGAAGSAAWVLTRATDFDGAPTGEIKAGEAVYVLSGSSNSGQGFVVTSTSDPHTVGSDTITWTQFTGTQAFSAGTYLTITGNTIDHDASGVSAAAYGSATQVPGYTVDAQGHLTAASNTTIAIPSTAITDFTEAVQDVTGAQVATNGSHTGIAATYDDAGDGAVDLTLTASGVSAASYGSATQVPGYTVDTYGRLTAASNTTIAIPSTAVTDFTEAVQDVSGAQLVTNGSHTHLTATYDDAGDGAIDIALNVTAVTAAAYGSATQVPGYTVDAYGRLTAASNTTIAIPSTAVTDFTEATQDVAGAQVATNGSHTGISAAYDDAGDGAIDLALTASGVSAAAYGSATQVPGYTVDVYGRLTAAANTTIAIPSTAVTDFTEAVQDVSGAQLATNGSHTGITATYDDAGDGAIDLALVTENVQDIAGAQLATNGSHTGITATYDDAGDGAVDLALITENVQDISGAQLATNGSHTGITATYDDAGDGAIDLALITENVQDIAGAQIATNGTHVGLTAAYDDAGDGAVDLTVAATLGTHTSGNYVATVAGTANEVDVSGSGSETAAVIVGLPAAVTVTTSLTTPLVNVSGASIVIEGATANDFETTLTVTDPTADRTITFLDETGTVFTTASVQALANGVTATTQSASDNSTKLATTAYVDTGLGALSSDSITDADGDTKIQVEESADEDIIRFDTAGTERMSIAADGTVTIVGNLTVSGTTTEISSTTITVDDKNIELGSVTTPTDVTADGGGLTLKGTTDKTFNWVDSTDAWTSSEHLALATGKSVYIDGVLQLSKNALAATVVLADGVAGTTQAQSNNSTKVATTAYVDAGLGALSSDSLTDTDGDTLIQVEESADEDIIRFDTAGTERMTIGATGIIATTGTNITLANVASPTDLTADGTGFTLKGAADYTIKWNDVDELTAELNYWESNQNIVATTPTKALHSDYKDHGLEIGTIALGSTIHYGTATAGSATTITLAAGASAVDDAYNTFKIRIRYGTGIGQERTITDYVGSTKVATVAAWTVTPDATTQYSIIQSYVDYSGIATVGQSPSTTEYLMATDGSYTYLGTGSGGNTAIYTYNGSLTARFDYGGVTLGYSGTKTYGRLTSHATGTTKTASYTAALVDESSYIWMNVASANTFTVPPASSVAFDSGTMMTIIQYGAGQTTITAGSGVTLIATPGLKLRDQNSVCTIVHYTADTWLVYGDLDD
ncbi:MAG: hypothetical protein CL489_00980 [Acidobacteria bacterium]|nr:hypothetical protein [Acidobacteriota bacterium]